MLAQIAPAAVQLLPAAQPEKKIQEFGDSHAEHEVGSVGFNFTSLKIKAKNDMHTRFFWNI